MDQSGGQYPQVPSVSGDTYANPQSSSADVYQPAPITQPQPNSFDMVGAPVAAPLSQQVPQTQYPAQTDDPLVATDTRPDWQQQIYSELNQGATDQLPYAPSQQAVAPTSSVEQLPIAPYAPAQTLEPSPHFQISYESATGEPVSNPQSSVAKKALIITLGILIPLAVLGGASFAGYSIGKKAGYALGVKDAQKSLADQSDANNQDTNQDANANDETALNFELAQPEYRDEVASGMVGEQLQLSDGMVVLVKSVEQNFQPTNGSYQQDSGKRLIKVNLLVGNADSTQPKTITNQTFGLREPSGAIITADTEVGEYEGQISTLPVSPGGKVRMSVVFSVGAGATPLVLVREQTYNLRSQGVVVNMNIAVDLGL